MDLPEIAAASSHGTKLENCHSRKLNDIHKAALQLGVQQ